MIGTGLVAHTLPTPTPAPATVAAAPSTTEMLAELTTLQAQVAQLHIS